MNWKQTLIAFFVTIAVAHSASANPKKAPAILMPVTTGDSGQLQIPEQRSPQDPTEQVAPPKIVPAPLGQSIHPGTKPAKPGYNHHAPPHRHWTPPHRHHTK